MDGLKNFNTYVFLLILLGISLLAIWLFKPFFAAIIFAVILAELFGGVYKFFLRVFRERKGLSSIFTIIVITLIIVIPLLSVVSLLANEAHNLFVALSAGDRDYKDTIRLLIEKVESISLVRDFDIAGLLSEEKIVGALKSLSGTLLSLVQKTYQGIAEFILMAVVTFFTVFYLLIDREKFAKKIMFLLPLKDEQERELSRRFVSITRATIKGTLVIGIIQGFLGGLVFWATGVHSAVIWAVIMTILSIIPAIGAGLVWVPAGIIMLALGNVWQGVVILLVGILVISTIDNLLRPKLVGRDSALHPLLIFFSTLGGLAAFGIGGFIIGPIIMALFVALWEIYGSEFKKQLEGYNR